MNLADRETSAFWGEDFATRLTSRVGKRARTLRVRQPGLAFRLQRERTRMP